MIKNSTGVKDRNQKIIHIGDTIKCDHPIYTKPKVFVVEDQGGRVNLPSDEQLLSYCEVVQNAC